MGGTRGNFPVLTTLHFTPWGRKIESQCTPLYSITPNRQVSKVVEKKIIVQKYFRNVSGMAITCYTNINALRFRTMK